MGPDGFVACTCYQDGLTGDPPIPRDQIVIDANGLPAAVGDTASPDEWTQEQINARWALDDWTDGACEQEFMLLASEKIALYDLVRIVSENLGWDRDRNKHVFGVVSHLSHGFPLH